jgi:hypothetical protein
MPSKPVDFLLDRGFARAEGSSTWLHLKWWQFHSYIASYFPEPLVPGFLAGRAMHMAIRE